MNYVPAIGSPNSIARCIQENPIFYVELLAAVYPLIKGADPKAQTEKIFAVIKDHSRQKAVDEYIREVWYI